MIVIKIILVLNTEIFFRKTIEELLVKNFQTDSQKQIFKERDIFSLRRNLTIDLNLV